MTKPCGGCGATKSSERCIGCLHDFEDGKSDWVHEASVTLPYERKNLEAATHVRDALALPLPDGEHDLGVEGFFDPWEIPGLDAVYGSYDQSFDIAMLEVLVSLRDRKPSDAIKLHHQIFREMLCRASLCDYGTGPRGCFPTAQFKALLPELIDKWRQFSVIAWRKDP